LYELFEHTADLGLRVHAATLEELLAEAARGLLAMLVANPKAVRPLQSRTITVAVTSLDYMLFDWLNELLYAFESEKLLLVDFDIRIVRSRLIAECRGEPMDASRHQMDHEVKAITYHGLKVEQTADGWQAELIVDI
jgi:SHS2 domain-containing protein